MFSGSSQSLRYLTPFLLNFDGVFPRLATCLGAVRERERCLNGISLPHTLYPAPEEPPLLQSCTELLRRPKNIIFTARKKRRRRRHLRHLRTLGSKYKCLVSLVTGEQLPVAMLQ